MAADATLVQRGLTMTMYYASGKRKHDRHFSLDPTTLELCWGKKADSKQKKREKLHAVNGAPGRVNPAQLFEEMDADSSGFLDAAEVAALYKQARGEKLGKKALAAAMATMDADGNGKVEKAEFTQWWHANGGDLDEHRDRALEMSAGDVRLLVVAPYRQTKEQWVAGCRRLLRPPHRRWRWYEPEPAAAPNPAPPPAPAPAKPPPPAVTTPARDTPPTTPRKEAAIGEHSLHLRADEARLSVPLSVEVVKASVDRGCARYVLKCTTLDGRQWLVQKRYSQFLELKEKLVTLFPATFRALPFPPKTFWPTEGTEPTVIEARKRRPPTLTIVGVVS